MEAGEGRENRRGKGEEGEGIDSLIHRGIDSLGGELRNSRVEFPVSRDRQSSLRDSRWWGEMGESGLQNPVYRIMQPHCFTNDELWGARGYRRPRP